MAKINCLFVTLVRNHEKNIIVVTKVKKKLSMYIPNYKLNRSLLTSSLGQIRLKHALKKTRNSNFPASYNEK